MTDSLRVRILAARLRVVLDQQLGRVTPKHVVDLAGRRIGNGPEEAAISQPSDTGNATRRDDAGT